MGVGLALLLVSLFTWGYQLFNGLIVTNMRNPFSWGMYIATFAFFVGIAAGGLMVSSSVYLFNLEKLKPFTKIASLSAFASTLGAAAMILPDMGRVDRIYYLLLHPNFRSPLIWDVVVITTYLVLTFFSVYVQLLPDWKKEGRGFLNGWTKNLSQEEVQEISRRWARRISIVGLPVAILIHTVTALIFATQGSRGWWNTAVLPPDFIAMAVASGTVLVLVMALLAVGKDNFAQYGEAFQTMARIAAGALAVHFFFVGVDLLVHGWWGGHEAKSLLHLLFGRYGVLYGIELALLAFTMIYFFTPKGRSSFNSLLLGSVMLFLGVFIHRMMLMYPAFNQFSLNLAVGGGEGWSYPIALGQFQEGLPVFVDFWPYAPTLVEYLITLLPFGLILCVFSLALRLYNFLPQEGQPKGQSREDSLQLGYREVGF